MINKNTSNSQDANKIKSKANSELELMKSRNKPIQVFGDIEFGMLSQECEKLGICRIEERNKIDLNIEYDNHKNKPGAHALLSVSPNGQIELAFFKANLNETTAKVFFSADKFIVGEDYTFIPTLGSSLSSFEIKKGDYSIIDTLGFLIVTFKKQESA